MTLRPGTHESILKQATLAWTDSLDATKGLAPFHEVKDVSGVPIDFLPLTKDDAAFNAAHNGENCVAPCGVGWAHAPGAVVADPERDRLLVFYRRMLRRGWFQEDDRVGASLAAWTRERLMFDRPVVRSEADVPTIRFGPDEPEWGWRRWSLPVRCTYTPAKTRTSTGRADLPAFRSPRPWIDPSGGSSPETACGAATGRTRDR
jgi:hypothetical protein